MKASVFQTKVQDLRRIVIPKGICDALAIKKGSTVEITITRVENASSCESSEQTPNEVED